MRFRYSLAILAFALPASAQEKITYDQHVMPFLRDKCLGCHNADKARGGLDLSTFSKTMEGGASGVVVKSGEPDASRLFTLTAHKEEPKMPPNAPRVADASLDMLRKWIAGGSLENNGSKPVPVKPKVEIALKSITRGKPAVPPMPTAKLRLDPVVVAPRLNAVTALAANPWSPLVAVGGQKQVLLYNGDTGDMVGVLPYPHGQINVLKFSRNGSLLLGAGGRGGHSGKATLWNVATGEVVIEVGNETDAIIAADLSADQTLIAVGGPSKMIRVYSTKDATLVRETKKHTDWITAIEFSPDAVLLATADRSSGIWVWEAATGRDFYNLRGHTAGVTDLSWRDDSNALASCSEDGTIRLWEMENGTNFKNWAAHGGGSQSVKFGHDNRLVSAGRDKVIKMWDGNGTLQRQFEALPDVALRTAFSHDQARVFGGDWSGLLRTWASADGKALVNLNTNPPTVAEQLAAANAALAAKQVAFDQTNAAYAATAAAATKAAADLAVQQKAMADTAAAAVAATAAVAPAKAKMDAAVAAFPPTQLKAQAIDAKAKAFAQAFATLNAAADANKANPELRNVANQAKPLADASAAEFVVAQKAMTDADAAMKAAQAAFAVATKAMADTAVAAKTAADGVPPKVAAAKAAADAVPPVKAKLDQTAAELAAAKAAVDKLKAVTVAAK